MATFKTLFSITLVLLLLLTWWDPVAHFVEASPRPQHHRAKRVIHGTPTAPGEVPFQAMLKAYGSHICGGAIVGSHWVLTAAHCFTKYQWDISVLTVTVGGYLREDNFLNTSTSHDVEAVYVPELFKCPSYSRDVVNYTSDCHHDIALIRTRLPFNFTEAVIRPIELADGSEVLEGQIVQISGWGVSNQPYTLSIDEYENEFPSGLLKANFQVLSDSQCRTALAQNEACFNPRHEMCTRGNETLAICYGDSGSPVTWNGKLVGVVSHSIPVPGYINKCSSTPFPDTHTRVSFYAPWIRETMLNSISSQWHLAVTKLAFPVEMNRGLVERAGCGGSGDYDEDEQGVSTTGAAELSSTTTSPTVEVSTEAVEEHLEEYEADLVSVFAIATIVLAAVGSVVYCVVRFVRLKGEGRKFNGYWDDEDDGDLNLIQYYAEDEILM